MKQSSIYALALLAISLQLNCDHSTVEQSGLTSPGSGNARDVEVPNRALVLIEMATDRDSMSSGNVLETAVPVIKLIFVCSSQDLGSGLCSEKLLMHLPVEVENDTSDYWRESLELRRRALVEGFPDAKNDADATIAFWNISTDFAGALTRSKISTPAGIRHVSDAEAWEIIGKLNRKADEVVISSVIAYQ